MTTPDLPPFARRLIALGLSMAVVHYTIGLKTLAGDVRGLIGTADRLVDQTLAAADVGVRELRADVLHAGSVHRHSHRHNP